MNAQALDRLHHHLVSGGFQAALLANPFTLTWLTGYAPSIQTGPSPFEGGPALGWYRDGQLTLVLNDWEAPAARAAGVEVREYTGYTIDAPLQGGTRRLAVLRDVLQAHTGLSGVIGVELDTLPAAALPMLQTNLTQATFQPIDADLVPLRAVKTAEEIVKIRAALRLCDLAQHDLEEQLRPGMTELELWGWLKARVELAAGERVPVLADLVAGPRTAEIGGPPLRYAVQPGDPVILDFVPRLDGYWGDNAATYFAGEPSSKLRGAYAAVHDALRRGVDAVRPGLRACDLDALMRSSLSESGYTPHPHHSGHGLGVAYHEEPRVVPYNTRPLEAGMVIALEPGTYLPGEGGIRLEHAVLVTDHGAEVLTQHLVL